LAHLQNFFFNLEENSTFLILFQEFWTGQSDDVIIKFVWPSGDLINTTQDYCNAHLGQHFAPQKQPLKALERRQVAAKCK
jgi:hypothetical protein